MSNFTIPRITEKRYKAIPPTLLTADGTINGLIEISNTYGFKVGQCVLFKQGTVHFKAKIQKVLSDTQFIVINPNESIVTGNKLDMSTYLIGATVELQESKRPVIDLLEIQRQIYEEEPTVALRTHSVDYLGRSYNNNNPKPTKSREEAVLVNLKTLEMLGIPLDNYIIVDNEIITLNDGTLIKASL